jgi:GntR family transcriptional regulator
MAEFAVSRPTIRSALNILKTEGRVHARQGRGVFVRSPEPKLYRRSDHYRRHDRAPDRPAVMANTATPEPPKVELLRFAPEPAAPVIAERLALAEGAMVLVTALRSSTADFIRELSTAYLPYDLVKGSPVADPAQQAWRSDPIANLARLGVHVDRVHEEVIARAATPQESIDLQLRPGLQVFQIARTMLAADTPVETCDIVMAADRYVLAYDITVE